MMAFLKLIRWSNLLMMVLTLIGAFYANLCQVPNPSKLVFFGILIVSIVSVAAGGYAINDYFDLRSDRKNKPEKIVVGKHIKKRRPNQIINAHTQRGKPNCGRIICV